MEISRTYHTLGGEPALTEYRLTYCPGRSTPPEFDDSAVTRDKHGREWKYDEATDVWLLRDVGDTFYHTSARSWDRLLFEFGPLVVDRLTT